VIIEAEVSWLECSEACVPGSAVVKSSMRIDAAARPSPEAGFLDTWQKRIPQLNPALLARARWDKASEGNARGFVIDGLAKDGFVPTDFYAYPDEGYDVGPKVTALPAEPGKFRLGKTIKRFAAAFPKEVPGVLVQATSNGQSQAAFEAKLNIEGKLETEPTSAATRAIGPLAAPAEGAAARAPRPGGVLLAMVGLAFVGGLVLNVMPCVLPVIALKILGFVRQSREAPRRVRKLGLVYGLGVVMSFLVLAGVVVAVQEAGGAASWGMQMQNVQFRLALTLVVALVALNLFGLFEMTLGSRATGAAAGLAAEPGPWGAFFNGVLATALATPCTAPFLTVALGFAFTQSPPVVVLMFAATALGLAAPSVVLSWQPAWLRFLPKPGPWMERFKVAMGFPMLATAVWLFDLTAPSFGEGGVLWLGLFLVVLALAAWIWGEFVQRGARRKWLAAGACVVLVGMGYAYALEERLHWRSPSVRAIGQGVTRDSPEGIEWRPWSRAAVEQARGQGHPVLVDFTAKWCLTCKLNKRLALDVPAVRAKLKAVNAVAFRADNTDPNAAITAELKHYGRAGVPLVLVFAARLDKPPLVLPALLTRGIVLDALDKAGE
jgi:thiol:disulfide interchange protein DsbD